MVEEKISSTVPDAAIRWLARFASSNVELAVLSNVNRHWRKQVALVILQAAEKEDNHDPVSSLLLPTMARRMWQEGDKNDVSGTFCLAWFPPMGIRILSVNLGEPMSSEEETDQYYNESCTDAFAPSGGPSYEGSEDEKKHQPPYRTLVAAAARVGRRATVSEPRRQTCSKEWRGYRVPFDVLRPFGYATDFINYVLLTVSERLAESKIKEEKKVVSQQQHRQKEVAKEYRTTIAVRGATFARPDGYCLCWDTEENAEDDAVEGKEEVISEWELVRRQETKRSKLMRIKRRRDLQQLVLPRMVLSTKDKRPPENSSIMEGKRQRSLQFLNAEGSHAVRIMTPPFACGPIQGAVTVFCVGIATEDGCFFSGLNHRYEMGHMYPTNPRDALIDMSPICLVADRHNLHQSNHFDGRLHKFSNPNSIDCMDSDDSSCDSHGKYSALREFGIKCECPIEDMRMGTSLSNYVDDEEDGGPREENIFRGAMGPGLWHCYVAVFDGENSMIRIDGRTEPLEMGRKDSDSNASSSSSFSSTGEPTLDGLTIGADHCFDMSLCYGDGMTGEGEGAISELAAFKGRMSLSDIESMERYLMEKHGIPTPITEPFSPLQEDGWRRQAHALIVQPPPWRLRGERVPLRVMSKHKSVAWHLSNDVTGKILPVPRIGSKHSTGSSDW